MSAMALLVENNSNEPALENTRSCFRRTENGRKDTPVLNETLRVLRTQDCVFNAMLTDITARDFAAASTPLSDPHPAPHISGVLTAMKRPVVKDDMPDHRSEIAELNREWRREMIDALKDVRVQISHLTDTLTRIREEFAKSGDVKELEARIDQMERNYEKAQSKLIGGYFVMQIVVAVGVWLAAHYWK